MMHNDPCIKPRGAEHHEEAFDASHHVLYVVFGRRCLKELET